MCISLSLTVRKFETIVVQPRPRLCLSPFRLYLTTLSGQSKSSFSFLKKKKIYIYIKTGKWRHKIVAGCDEDTRRQRARLTHIGVFQLFFGFHGNDYSRTRDDVVRLIQLLPRSTFTQVAPFHASFFRVVDLEKWGEKTKTISPQNSTAIIPQNDIGLRQLVTHFRF